MLYSCIVIVDVVVVVVAEVVVFVVKQKLGRIGGFGTYIAI